jgi:hypothetical protein
MKYILLLLILLNFTSCKDSKVSKTGNQGPDRSQQNICPTLPVPEPTDPPICEQYILNNELASTAIRTKGSEQLSIFNEIVNAQNGTLPGNYSNIADFNKDNEGVVETRVRPTQDCGIDVEFDSVDKKIANCAELNTDSALWNGAENGIAAEVNWKLVAKKADNEVWRDEQTKLIWSADLGNANWCQASGETREISSTAQPYTVDCSIIGKGESLCTDDAFGIDAKAGLFGISWKLPSRADYLRADVNGFRNAVMPNMSKDVAGQPQISNQHYWTSSSYSIETIYGWVYGSRYGDLKKHLRSDPKIHIRCVGRGN